MLYAKHTRERSQILGKSGGGLIQTETLPPPSRRLTDPRDATKVKSSIWKAGQGEAGFLGNDYPDNKEPPAQPPEQKGGETA